MRPCNGNCGDYCCRQLVRTITETEKIRLDKLAKQQNLILDIGDKDWFLYTWKDTPCPFYNGKCSIYEDRPMVCKSWVCTECATSEERKQHSQQILSEEALTDSGWAWFSRN